jgi:hypothetical protein
MTVARFPSPPAEDDEDAYIFIDHREEEDSIVEYVSARLAPADALEVEWDDEQMSVRHRGRSHPIPLQFSPHDRYIMISSLAELLREDYRFFLLEPSLGDDTHALLVVSGADARGWDEVPEHLAALELGHDYFHDIAVPYLNHEASAPEFANDRERVDSGKQLMAGVVKAMFAGAMDDATAAGIARLNLQDPELRKAAEGKTEAQLAQEIKQEFDASLASAEGMEHQRELDKAMADLKALTSPPPKPWWKIW